MDVPQRTDYVAAWLRRFAGVGSRVGQLWSRDGLTFLVVGEPALVEAWEGTLSNAVYAACRRGWCHEVVNLDDGTMKMMNEVWFSDGENGKNVSMGRIV